MKPLDLVKLSQVMKLSTGSHDIAIALLDSPIDVNHSYLVADKIHVLVGEPGMAAINNRKYQHGTFIAGILCGKRDSPAPAICPDCTLLVRPIFDKTPYCSPEELATAIRECANQGAQVINISASFSQPSTQTQNILKNSLDYAVKRGVIVVAAAGNQGSLGSSSITRHPWVIPVVAYNCKGKIIDFSNLGHSIGKRGLGAPGEAVTSLSVGDSLPLLEGTSVATPFVTGAIALLWSIFPFASADEVRHAVTTSPIVHRNKVVPPLLDAWAAYQYLKSTQRKGRFYAQKQN